MGNSNIFEKIVTMMSVGKIMDKLMDNSNFKLDDFDSEFSEFIVDINSELQCEYQNYIDEYLQQYLDIVIDRFINEGFKVCVCLISDIDDNLRDKFIDELKILKVKIPTEIIITFKDGSDLSCTYGEKMK